MARIRQIRDVIMVRQQEALERDLTYKEIEVRAVTGAIHSAAGNANGAKRAQEFSFHKKEPAVASYRKVAAVFRPDADGLITDDELNAEIERQKALL